MALFFPRSILTDKRAMVFIDGENLAMRYGNLLKTRWGYPL